MVILTDFWQLHDTAHLARTHQSSSCERHLTISQEMVGCPTAANVHFQIDFGFLSEQEPYTVRHAPENAVFAHDISDPPHHS